jgi:hypothetical protein
MATPLTPEEIAAIETLVPAKPTDRVLLNLYHRLAFGRVQQEEFGDCGLETIQTLLDLLNPLHGDLDRQLFDERRKSSGSEMDTPRDAEYSVNITEGEERDLTQAVLILEDRKRAALLRGADIHSKRVEE